MIERIGAFTTAVIVFVLAVPLLVAAAAAFAAAVACFAFVVYLAWVIVGFMFGVA